MMNEKTTLRAHLRALRDRLDGEYIAAASRSACERIAQLDEFKSATAILFYFPINNEISPLFLLDMAQKWGKKIAFPVCDHESGTLTFRELPAFHIKNDNTTENNPHFNKSLPCVSEGAEERGGGIVSEHLIPAKFGLFEPNNTCPILIPDEKTLCIVPAIAFDENGNRLGYGKGFYDRFLSNFNGASIGLTCSDLLVKQLPTDPHDTPVKIVITESEIIKIPK